MREIGNKKRLISIFAGLLMLFGSTSAGTEKNPLAEFESFVTIGKPKNMKKILALYEKLSEEDINKFNANHTGFVNAYTVITENENFKVESDWDIHEVIRLSKMMDDFIEIFRNNMGLKKSDILQCHLRLYKSPEEFRRETSKMGLGMGVGGWFNPPQRMIVTYWNPDPLFHHDTVLIHECTHLINFLIMQEKWKVKQRMPTWMNEGMAVFWESSYKPWSGELDMGRNPFSRLVHLKNQVNDPKNKQKWTDSKQLLSTVGPIPGNVYAEVWAFVHFMCFEYGESKKKPFSEFSNLYAQVTQGKRSGLFDDMEKFFKERTNQNTQQVLDEIIEYVKKAELPKTFLNDGTTEIAWSEKEEAASDKEVAWKRIVIANEDFARAASSGAISAAELRRLKNEAAGGGEASSGEELGKEFATFFGAGGDFAKVDLQARGDGKADLQDNFLELDLTSAKVPSDVFLKTANTDVFEIKVKMIVDGGFAGIRFSGEAEAFDKGYFLGISAGKTRLTNFATGRDLDSKADMIKAGEEYEVTFKVYRQEIGGETKEIAEILVGDKRARRIAVKDLQPGRISVHVRPDAKARFGDIQARKP